jgi:hypothetical protein
MTTPGQECTRHLGQLGLNTEEKVSRSAVGHGMPCHSVYHGVHCHHAKQKEGKIPVFLERGRKISPWGNFHVNGDLTGKTESILRQEEGINETWLEKTSEFSRLWPGMIFTLRICGLVIKEDWLQ